MVATNIEIGRKTPWHLWVVGGVSFLWHAIGAVDYIMTQTKNEQYMANFTPEQLDYFYSFPVWFTALWAVAIWGSVLGSILLLLRKKLAAPVFLVSFIAMALNSVWSYGFSNGLEMMGTSGAAFSGVIFIVALALLFYSRAMAKRDILR